MSFGPIFTGPLHTSIGHNTPLGVNLNGNIMDNRYPLMDTNLQVNSCGKIMDTRYGVGYDTGFKVNLQGEVVDMRGAW